MANTSPAADMGCLIAESKRLLNSSLSHNTHKAYQAALNKLQFFLTHYGLHQTWHYTTTQCFTLYIKTRHEIFPIHHSHIFITLFTYIYCPDHTLKMSYQYDLSMFGISHRLLAVD
jgi:hypothetical protein